MSNRAYIRLKEERVLNAKLEPIQEETSISVYMSTDEVSCWVGEVSTVEELHELIGPENLRETLDSALSENELYIVNCCLFCNDNVYYLDDQRFVMEED